MKFGSYQGSNVIRSKWTSQLLRLKVCKECMQEDEARYGEPYWHRSHQLDGIYFCSKHKVLLQEADSNYTTGTWAPLEVLTLRTKTKSFVPEFSERTRQRLLELSLLASQLLDYEWPRKPPLSISPTDIPGLRKAFPSTVRIGKLAMPALISAFYDHFGNETLELFGIHPPVNRKHWWLRDYLKSFQTPNAIKHLLLQNFHEQVVTARLSQERTNYSNLVDFATLKLRCRNPIAPHFGEVVPMKIKKTLRFEKISTITVLCECGFKYSTDSSICRPNEDPPILKILEFGDMLRNHIEELRDQGQPTPEIARKLNIKYGTVYKMLNRTCPSGVRRFPAEALQVISNARAARRAAIDKQPPQQQERTGPRSLDGEKLAKFRQSANEVLLLRPPVRVSINKILDRVNVKNRYILMPNGSKSELREQLLALTESKAEFAERKARILREEKSKLN